MKKIKEKIRELYTYNENLLKLYLNIHDIGTSFSSIKINRLVNISTNEYINFYRVIRRVFLPLFSYW